MCKFEITKEKTVFQDTTLAFTGRTEKNQWKPQLGQSAFQPILQPGTQKYKSEALTALKNCIFHLHKTGTIILQVHNFCKTEIKDVIRKNLVVVYATDQFWIPYWKINFCHRYSVCNFNF